MNHWYFIVPLAVASYVACLALGYLIGLHLRQIREWLGRLQAEADRRREEDQEDLLPNIITTTPRVIEAKRRAGKLVENDEDSAIVTVKSPQQIKRDKDEQLKRELDEVQGRSSRIG